MSTSALFDTKTPALFLTRHRFLLHIIVWTALLVYDSLVWGMVNGAFKEKFISSLVELPVKAGHIFHAVFL